MEPTLDQTVQNNMETVPKARSHGCFGMMYGIVRSEAYVVALGRGEKGSLKEKTTLTSRQGHYGKGVNVRTVW